MSTITLRLHCPDGSVQTVQPQASFGAIVDAMNTAAMQVMSPIKWVNTTKSGPIVLRGEMPQFDTVDEGGEDVLGSFGTESFYYTIVFSDKL